LVRVHGQCGRGWHTTCVAAKDRGPRPQPSPSEELRSDLQRTFRWLGDRTDDRYRADPTGWWADASILGRLGPALAELFGDQEPTLVLGPQSRGALLGALVATHLGIGMVELRKDPSPAADSDRWLIAHTPPDYRDRNLRLGARKDHLNAGERVLLVDDWIQTGGQATGARAIVEQSGATWCGVAVIVDGLSDSRLRRDLDLRSLVNVREL
jgi:adenine phosphoribosyltransferase